MDYSHGIPPEARTLVVIPTMLLSSQNINDMAEALEVRFLANRDENLHFALLTDFLDADKENLPEDESLTQLAKMRIEELNQKYPGFRILSGLEVDIRANGDLDMPEDQADTEEVSWGWLQSASSLL